MPVRTGQFRLNLTVVLLLLLYMIMQGVLRKLNSCWITVVFSVSQKSRVPCVTEDRQVMHKRNRCYLSGKASNRKYIHIIFFAHVITVMIFLSSLFIFVLFQPRVSDCSRSMVISINKCMLQAVLWICKYFFRIRIHESVTVIMDPDPGSQLNYGCVRIRSLPGHGHFCGQ
jgi:hypothetical protein